MDWAASRKASFVWTEGRRTFELRGNIPSMAAEADSRRMVIGGVVVYLSAPVAVREGRAFVSGRDFRKVIQPFVSPAQTLPKSRIKTICLDAGHGGRDPGNLHGNLREKDLTLTLAQELEVLLRQAGYKVVMTRSADSYPELEDRPSLANRRKADLFISLHFNSVPDGEGVRGCETFCLTPAGHASTNERQSSGSAMFAGNRNDASNLMLAYQVQKALVTRLGAEDRGVKQQRFAVLKTTTMPAILVEAGFLTDPQEARQLASKKHLVRIAQAVHSGIEAYRRLVERP